MIGGENGSDRFGAQRRLTLLVGGGREIRAKFFYIAHLHPKAGFNFAVLFGVARMPVHLQPICSLIGLYHPHTARFLDYGSLDVRGHAARV